MISFTVEECSQVIEYRKELKEVYRDDSDRDISYTYWSIGNSEKFNWIFNKFDRFLESQIKNLRVIKQLDAIHMFRYRKGNMFVKHRDIYYPNQIYNVGVNLTDDYIGGDFKLYGPDVTLKKQKGSIYQFIHSREHEVTEITSGERWSLIGFYFYDNINLTPPSI